MDTYTFPKCVISGDTEGIGAVADLITACASGALTRALWACEQHYRANDIVSPEYGAQRASMFASMRLAAERVAFGHPVDPLTFYGEPAQLPAVLPERSENPSSDGGLGVKRLPEPATL